MNKRDIRKMLAGALAACIWAAGGSAEANAETSVEVTVRETEEEMQSEADTGDAFLDKVRNEDKIGENELLVVSEGTSFNDSRRWSIGSIEQALEEEFPDWGVRRGFTSDDVIDCVEQRDGIHIDNLDEALGRGASNDVINLVVQPTFLTGGQEYEEILDMIAEYADSFGKVAVGEPLLTSQEDYEAVAKAMLEMTKEYDDGETSVIFMGRGADEETDPVFEKIRQMLTEKGAENICLVSIDSPFALNDLFVTIGEQGHKRVVLCALMAALDDEVNSCMQGDGENSWKTAFEGSGYEVIVMEEALGQNPAILKRYAAHAQEAIDNLLE